MPQTQLPPWRWVLAVVAHPDESSARGAVLAAFAEGGARVSVLCLTRGDASTLHGVAGHLTELRADELTAAAAALGLRDVTFLANPDGRLPEVDLDELAAHVVTAAHDVDADGIIGFDLTDVTGHRDHAHATSPRSAPRKTSTCRCLAGPSPSSPKTRSTCAGSAGIRPLNAESSATQKQYRSRSTDALSVRRYGAFVPW